MRKHGKMAVFGWLAAAMLPLAWSADPDGLIRGRVLQAPGLAPLSGVLITIRPARPDARSAADGAFSISSLRPGRYVLRFQKAGSVSREITLGIGPGEIVEIETVLEPTRLGLHEEITVTAERDPRAAFQSPAAVSALTAGDFGGRGLRTLPELLTEAPGVWLQKTNHGGGSPFLRGLTGNQVLALVDGIRLNNSTYRYGPNQYLNTVDLFSVDRAEVVRGSGATLYGSDAIGGVLNFLTAPPP